MPDFLGFPYINPLNITSNQPAFVSDTVNLKRQSVKTGAQRWEFSINFRAGYNSNILGLFMAHYADRGEGVAFDIDAPQNPGVEENTVITNTPMTNGEATEGDSTVVIDGGTYVIPIGALITFANHDKVYMTTTSTNSSTSISITPPLRETVPDNTSLQAENVKVSVFHNAPNGVTTYDANGTQGVTWTFVEAL